MIHQLALRIRGTFDLDELLQLVAEAVGQQLTLDYCLVYLYNPGADTLRWRAGYNKAELTPLRWPLRESDFPDLFMQLRKGEMVRIDDPTGDPLVASSRPVFESAGVRTLVFMPARSEQLEAVLILGQVKSPARWSEQQQRFLETVAAEVAVAARHITLASALRQAGHQATSATAELQAENQYLQQLIQLLLLPSTDLTQVLNHISESLARIYNVTGCSIEELQIADCGLRIEKEENPQSALSKPLEEGSFQARNPQSVVRSMCLSGQITNLGVFPIEMTPRQQVVESAQPTVCLHAAEDYPEDQFLKDHDLDFYAGVPIFNRTGELMGLLNLFHQDAVNLQKRDFKLLTAIARRIGFELEEERAAGARKLSEEEIQQRLREVTQWQEQMKFIQQARELIRSAETLEAGLQELVNLANKHMDSDFAAIALLDENRQFERLITAGIESAVQEAISHLPTGKGLLGLVIEQDTPLRLDNVTHHPRFTGFPSNHPVMRSFLAVPLRVRGERVGSIYFADKRGGDPFSQEDESFASELAALIIAECGFRTIQNPSKRGLTKPDFGFKTLSDSPNPQSALPEPPEGGSYQARNPQSEGRSEVWNVFSDLFHLIEQQSAIRDPQSAIEEVCASLVDGLTKLLPDSAVAIWLLDPSSQHLAQAAGCGAPVERLAEDGPIPLGNGAIGRAAISGQVITIDDLHQDEGVPEELRSLVNPDESYTSATIFPLKTMDKTLGVILLFLRESWIVDRGSDLEPRTSNHESRITNHDLRSFLEVLAYCLGSFIEQSRMMEAVSRTSVEMATMQTVIESISEPTNLGQICDEILNNLTESLDISHAALFLRQSAERELLLFRYRGINEAVAGLGRHITLEKAEESINGLETGEPLLISELETDPRINNQQLVELLRAEGLRSGLILPLQSNIVDRGSSPVDRGPNHESRTTSHELAGVLVLASQEAGHFSHYSREFFSIITNRIASAIQGSGIRRQGSDVRDQGSEGLRSEVWGLTPVLLENLTSGVVAIDGQGHVTIFNPAMQRLSGYQQHEVLGRPIADCGLRAVLTAADLDIAELFNPKSGNSNPPEGGSFHARNPKSVEVRLLTKSGGRKYVTLTVTPLWDEEGAQVGAVGLFTDITEIRALEHERYRLTPLALVGEMSARLAHEIKNPLASMMSGLELLGRRLEYGEGRGSWIVDRESALADGDPSHESRATNHKTIERLIAELRRLDTTVREMLAYSRTSEPTLAPTDPVDPLERALDMLLPQLEAAKISIERDYQPELAPTLMDANQMEQVFLNLILNSIQAMPDGGTLRLRIADCGLRVEKPNRRPKSAIRGRSDGPQSAIEYVVSDTGMGISPDITTKIFDPFFSTKTHGTGLGLASVKKIIEAHQAQIRVESQPGEGAAFTIRLPAQMKTQNDE